MDFIIEVSARHVHLSQDHLYYLFGKDTYLTISKALSQPGQFLALERVDIIGPKGTFEKVAIHTFSLGASTTKLYSYVSSSKASGIAETSYDI